MLKEKCPYFGKCGGCVWQDLSEEEYIAKKESFVRYAFRDVGLDVMLKPVVLIPTGTRRRASFAFVSAHFGFNALKSHTIVDIDSCPLLLKRINDILPALKTVLTSLKIKGNVFVLDTPVGLDIHVKANKSSTTLEQLEKLSKLAENDAISRVVYNEMPVFEKMHFPISADGFAQPSLEGEETLIKLVVENIDNAKTVIDLFAGAGTFSWPLLDKGIKVRGYDCSEAIKNLGEFGFERDLFRNPLNTDELGNTDVVILDPPRAGALAQVEQLADSLVKKIIMISCNPKTAARDAKILTDHGWRMSEITLVDQFTYSNHIEIVIVFTRD